MSQGLNRDYEMAVGSTNILDSTLIVTDSLYPAIDPTAVPDASAESTWATKNGVSHLCRLCANAADYLIPIYDGQGLEHKLEEKIHKHLPLQVSQSDALPLVVCYTCASTVLAWDTLLAGCLEADQKLKTLLEETTVCAATTIKQAEEEEELLTFDEPPAPEPDSDDEPLSSKVQQLSKGSPIKKQILSKTKRVTTRSDKTANNSKEEGEGERWLLPGGKGYSCDRCPALLNNRTEMVRHMLNNHKLPIYHCGDCDLLISTRKADIIRHVNSHSRIDGHSSYRCEKCLIVMKSKMDLVRHSLNVHGDRLRFGRRFTCDQCGRELKGWSAMRYHLKHVHGGVKEEPCSICGRRFATRAAREDHERTHTGERPFICATCGKTFGSRAALYIHMRSHTDSFPFACSVCPRRFRWLQQLRTHVLKHTGEKNHVCDQCKRSFRTRNELTRHSQVHSTDKPFLCLACGSAFGQKRYLRNHEKARHGSL